MGPLPDFGPVITVMVVLAVIGLIALVVGVIYGAYWLATHLTIIWT